MRAQEPCADNKFQQVPAVFNGLTTYKNGVKGAIATQVRVRKSMHARDMLDCKAR